VTNAGSYVTLSQVPYTGFTASPFMTMMFWLAILAVSAFIAYLFTVYRPFARMQRVAIRYAERYHETERMQHLVQVADAMPTTVAQSAPLVLARVASAVTDDGAAVIEEEGHKENILLSPEAARMVMAAIEHSGEPTPPFLNALFSKAKAQFPREDGWILLSKERTQALLSRGVTNDGAVAGSTNGAPVGTVQYHVAAPETSAARPVRSEPARLVNYAPGTNNAPAADHAASAHANSAPETHERPAIQHENGNGRTTTEVIRLFVEVIVAADQRRTYELLRKLTSQGVAADTFVIEVVRKLDDIYKNRLEGNHNPDPDLAAKTATWSNGDFERVLGTLVESVDGSYANPRVGTKVAIAKLLEYFAAKHA
jgi:hypothetical protein